VKARRSRIFKRLEQISLCRACRRARLLFPARRSVAPNHGIPRRFDAAVHERHSPLKLRSVSCRASFRARETHYCSLPVWGTGMTQVCLMNNAWLLMRDSARGRQRQIPCCEGRTKESVYYSLGSYSLNDLAEVEAVAIDMSQTYVSAVRACIKGADEKIVFDRFHVVQHMTDAVDKVRRGECQQLREEGDDRLVGSRYFWLYGRENVPDKHLVSFDILRNAKLKTARAWAIKEQLRDLWDQPTLEDGEAWWMGWFRWASHSRLEPVKKVARMIKQHLPNVLTYFTTASRAPRTKPSTGSSRRSSRDRTASVAS